MQLGEQIFYLDIIETSSWIHSRIDTIRVCYATLISVDKESDHVIVRLPWLFTNLKAVSKKRVFATREEIDSAIYKMLNDRIKS